VFEAEVEPKAEFIAEIPVCPRIVEAAFDYKASLIVLGISRKNWSLGSDNIFGFH